MADVYQVQRADGAPAVLKCYTPTGQREEIGAAEALSAWAGTGAVRVLDRSDSALLMEACDPTPLAREDHVALPILSEVAARLHQSQAPLSQAPELRARCDALDAARATGAARSLIARARDLSRALLDTAPEPQLLHGDFHHDNVLHSARGWLAIDPQPLRGERAYDLANLFSNPLDRPDIVLADGRALRLAKQLSHALDLAAERLLAWGFVHACISAAWSLQDGTDPSHRLAVARAIAAQAQPLGLSLGDPETPARAIFS